MSNQDLSQTPWCHSGHGIRMCQADIPESSGSPQDTAAQPDSLSCALGNSGTLTVPQTPHEDSDQRGQPDWDVGPSAVPVEACSI